MQPVESPLTDVLGLSMTSYDFDRSTAPVRPNWALDSLPPDMYST